MSGCLGMGDNKYRSTLYFSGMREHRGAKGRADGTGEGKSRVGLLAPGMYTVCQSASILVFC